MSIAGDKVYPIIDRFEGDWAVIEYGGVFFNFPRALLPVGLREGSVLKFRIERDVLGTDERRKKIERLEDELFR